MRTIFMGTPAFAIPSLEVLFKSTNVVAVYTQPPKPCGRGGKIQVSPVEKWAQEKELLVLSPSNLKSDLIQEQFIAFKADLVIVAAYGHILPPAILTAPKYGCINVHASLLPRWRGASPIQSAILHGDDRTGVTIMQMDAGMDTGDIIAMSEIAITSTTTANELFNTLAVLGGKTLSNVISNIENISKIPQPLTGVTYANKINKIDGLINWHNSCVIIDRQIRSLTPWPGIYFYHKDVMVKIIKASVNIIQHSFSAGTFWQNADRLAVATNDGMVYIEELQQAGGKILKIQDFLRGHPNFFKIDGKIN